MSRLASTFLSHASVDQALVAAVAEELGRRGIVAWLDRDELQVGQSLSEALRAAIHEQFSLTLFVSVQALNSTWVQDELGTALDYCAQNGLKNLINPVYLGDPLDLVRSSPLLRQAGWLNAKGNAVDMLGIAVDPAEELSALARRIADKLACGIYASLGSAEARDVAIHIDQRDSSRTGKPRTLPVSHGHISGPTLVFRPRRSQGEQKETLVADEWNQFAQTIKGALAQALGTFRKKKNIYLSGQAQLGLAFLLGRLFDCSTEIQLYCADVRNQFSNEGWDRLMSLSGGDAHCEANGAADLPPIPQTPFSEILLLIGRSVLPERVKAYREAAMADKPVAWVRSPERLESSELLQALIADVTALLRRLKKDYGCRKAYLILDLPFPAVPILAAHLHPYVLESLELLEFRGDTMSAKGSANSYAPLAMP